MSAPISIIMPSETATDPVGPSAHALMEGLSEGLIRELVLTAPDRDPAPAAMAEALGAVLVPDAGTGPAACRAGADCARGAWLLFLAPGARPAPGWSAALRDHVTTGAGQAARFRTGAGGRPLPLALAALAPGRCGTAGLLVPRSRYLSAGGHPQVSGVSELLLLHRLRPLLLDAALDVSGVTPAATPPRRLRNLGRALRHALRPG